MASSFPMLIALTNEFITDTIHVYLLWYSYKNSQPPRIYMFFSNFLESGGGISFQSCLAQKVEWIFGKKKSTFRHVYCLQKIYKSIPIPYQLERGRSRSRERRGMLGWMLAESHCLQPLGNLPIYTSSLLPQCAEFGKPWQWYWDNMFCSIGWLLVIWIISITKRTSII